MKIIREYSKAAKTCVLLTNTYDSRLSYFLGLFEAAKGDFPFLRPEEITIKLYSGERYKNTFGIEFGMGSSVPESYTRITELETTVRL